MSKSSQLPYVIACDSQRNDDILFMVDRRKEKRSFWSYTLDAVMLYADKGAAQRKCRSLHYNNPRVMSLDEAQRIARIQDDEHVHQQAMADCEAGWDAHKDWR